VDVLYGKLGDRGKAWIDILGTLVFLFPWLVILAFTSAPFVLSSWSVREASATADGMPALYACSSQTATWLHLATSNPIGTSFCWHALICSAVSFGAVGSVLIAGSPLRFAPVLVARSTLPARS
jgi:hypothetical protein